MTEYWKSYAKKFCEICKCWYADNKVSAERHEQGLRHKAMVQQRLRESAKKAKDKEVEDHDLRMTLLAMEQAARASISSREEREVPTVSAPRIITYQRPTTEPSEEDDVKAKLREQKRKLADLKKRSKKSQFWSPDEGEMEGGELAPGDIEELAEWVQAETPDGQFYYWHIYTGETRWDQPEKFYSSTEYAERYADIVAETNAGREGDANSTATVPNYTNLSIAGTSQTTHPDLIDPSFVHQMTAAEVNSQMAPNEYEAPPPMKKYYGMRGKHDDDQPNGRRTYDEDEKSNAQQQLTREERRKIRRERKAMSDKSDGGSRIPDGLVELKVEAPSSVIGEQLGDGETTKPSPVSKFSSHPLGPWVPVKREEKRPDLDSSDFELQTQGKKRTKRYDDLPEQSYGPGSVDYSQTPAELLEIAEMDPEDLTFKTKQTEPQKSQKYGKGKVIGFRKPGTSHATKSFRTVNKTE